MSSYAFLLKYVPQSVQTMVWPRPVEETRLKPARSSLSKTLRGGSGHLYTLLLAEGGGRGRGGRGNTPVIGPEEKEGNPVVQPRPPLAVPRPSQLATPTHKGLPASVARVAPR